MYIKISKNLSAKYFQEHKERLQKKAREKYQSLSKEGNEKKRQNKLVEYRKKYYRMRKNTLLKL